MVNEEIKIGNVFKHKKIWSYRNPEADKEFLFKWDQNDWYALGECTLQLDDIEPIEITEKILLKCGFAVEYTIGGFLRWQLGDFKLIDRKLPYPCRHKMDIKYLHQLQNLYFSLTGEEVYTSKLFK